MDLTQARDVLGVDAADDWEIVRSRYRDRIRATHPDVAGDAGTHRATQLNAAYRMLGIAKREGRLHEVPEPSRPAAPASQATAEAPGPRRPGGPPVAVRPKWTTTPIPAPDVRVLDDDTLVLSSPPDEAFRRLVEAVHEVADVSYLDRSSSIFEAVVTLDDGVTASLVVSLQWRAHDATTEAFCTLESLQHPERLDVRGVLEQIRRYVPPDPEDWDGAR